MANSNSTQTYLGKVNGIEEDLVYVTIWDSKKQEVYGELPINYFNTRNLEIGRIFRYTPQVKARFVRTREPSAKEIAKMRKEIERKLPKNLEQL